MSPCTLWYRFIPGERPRSDPWHFNHLEDGHPDIDRPTPKHPDHAGWAHSRWQRVRAWLTTDVPPCVVHYSPDEVELQ